MFEVFKVIDLITEKEADKEWIIKTEEWANHLVPSSLGRGWAIDEDGTLMLIDECLNVAFAPKNRFKIEWEQNPTEIAV